VETRFWLVLRNGAKMQTSVRHGSRESAIAEAQRLANLQRGDKFYVAAVTGYAFQPVEPQATFFELSKSPFQPEFR